MIAKKRHKLKFCNMAVQHDCARMAAQTTAPEPYGCEKTAEHKAATADDEPRSAARCFVYLNCISLSLVVDNKN